MRITREEADKMMADQRVKNAPFQQRMAVNPQYLEQAQLATKHVTASAEWNVFLQRVQALADQERALIAGMADAIALPNLTSEQVLQAQRHMLAAKARVEAWEQVLNLPTEILATSEPKAA